MSVYQLKMSWTNTHCNARRDEFLTLTCIFLHMHTYFCTYVCNFCTYACMHVCNPGLTICIQVNIHENVNICLTFQGQQSYSAGYRQDWSNGYSSQREKGPDPLLVSINDIFT